MGQERIFKGTMSTPTNDLLDTLRGREEPNPVTIDRSTELLETLRTPSVAERTPVTPSVIPQGEGEGGGEEQNPLLGVLRNQRPAPKDDDILVPTPAVPERKPLLPSDAELKADLVQNNVANGIRGDAASAAKNQRLAKTLGVSVDALPPDAESQAAIRRMDIDKLVESNPATALFLQKAENAAVVGANVEELSGIESVLRRTVSDPLVSLVKGGLFLSEGVVGVGSLLTGGVSGKGLSLLGVDFERTQKAIDTLYSADQQAKNKEFEGVEGFLPNVGFVLKNPSIPAHTILSSLPSMFGGGAIGRELLTRYPSFARAVIGIAEKNPVIAQQIARHLPKLGVGGVTAAGEGLLIAGGLAERIRRENPDGLITGKQAAIAAGAGIAGGAFTLLGSRLSEKLGVLDLDTAITRGSLEAALTASSAPKNLITRITTGAALEGPVQEVPQEVIEQVAENVATGKPWDEGIDKAAALALVTGSSMGAGTQVLSAPSHAKQVARLRDIVVDKAATEAFRDMILASVAGDNAERIRKLGAIVRKSEIKQRSPETLRDFARILMDDETIGLAEVYVDAPTLSAVLEQSGIKEEQLAETDPELVESLRIARSTGSDVRIPLDTYISRFAGTPAETGLIDNLKIDPEGMTFAEAKAFTDKQEETFGQQATRLLEETEPVPSKADFELQSPGGNYTEFLKTHKNKAEALEADIKQVHDILLTELNKAKRFDKATNAVYSVPLREFYAVNAVREGLMPSELYNRLPLRFENTQLAGLFSQEPIEGPNTSRPGGSTAKFFASVTDGSLGVPEGEYVPVLPVNKDRQVFQTEQDKHRGAFDDHIRASIPGFGELQAYTGDAIVKAYPNGGKVLDIGASEGSWAKAITALSQGKIETDALEPLESMIKTFEETSTVPGSRLLPQGWGAGWVEEATGFVVKPFAEPDGTYDVIHEAMTFQFISNNREAQIALVKKALKTNGVFLTEEKFADDGSPAYAEREAQKDKYKAQYFTAAEIANKAKEVLAVGMNSTMVSEASLEFTLSRKFNHVAKYWTAGNFAGYAASDDLGALTRIVEGIGDTTTEFSNKATLKDFEKGNLQGILNKNDWAIITAELTSNSKEQNEKAMRFLKQELESKGFEHTETLGRYFGEDKESPGFLIFGIDTPTAHDMGNRYGQDSVLVRRGLVFQDGSYTEPADVSVFDTREEGFATGGYTFIPATGGIATVNFPNFDRKVQPDSVKLDGIHYSRQVRTELKGSFAGTGLPGADSARLQESFDDRIRKFVDFYVDTGNGVIPEAGLGGVKHVARLNNIYDASSNSTNARRFRVGFTRQDLNNFESAVLDAGFDGYFTEQGARGRVRIFGSAADAIPVEVLGDTTLGQSEINNLLVMHNLSAVNLRDAARLGGLPAISMAITTPESSLTSFGEITLIGPKEILTDGVQIFDADVYSARAPTIEGKIDEKKFRAFIDSLGDVKGLELPVHFDGLMSIARIRAELSRFAGVRYAWLKSIGEEPKRVYKKQKTPFAESIKAVMREDGVKNLTQFRENTKIARMIIEQRPWFADSPSDMFHHARQLFAALELEIKTNNADLNRLAREVNNRVPELRDEYAEWIEERVRPLLSRSVVLTESGVRQAVTLSNIVREMTRKIRAAEQSTWISPGVFRASRSKRFKSLNDLRKHRGQLVSPAVMDGIAADFENEVLSKLRDIEEFYKLKSSNPLDYVGDALTAIMGGPPAWRRAFDVNPKVEKIIEGLVALADDMPTQYFEAKSTRVIQITEFSAAVVPQGASKTTFEALERAGLKIVTYPDTGGEARSKAIRKVASQNNSLLFQSGFYSALLNTLPKLVKIANKEGKIKVKQARAWFLSRQKAGDFKQEELRYSGLLDLMDGLGDEESLTVEGIVKYASENGVRINTVAAGSFAKATPGAVDRALTEAFGGIRRSSTKSFTYEFRGKTVTAVAAPSDLITPDGLLKVFKMALVLRVSESEFDDPAFMADVRASVEQARDRGSIGFPIRFETFDGVTDRPPADMTNEELVQALTPEGGKLEDTRRRIVILQALESNRQIAGAFESAIEDELNRSDVEVAYTYSDDFLGAFDTETPPEAMSVEEVADLMGVDPDTLEDEGVRENLQDIIDNAGQSDTPPAVAILVDSTLGGKPVSAELAVAPSEPADAFEMALALTYTDGTRISVEDWAMQLQGEAIFESYVLPGQYTNYQEIALTLPTGVLEVDVPVLQAHEFSSGEANVNRVAHMRVNTRGLLARESREEGTALHIEEIQSDWGQQGRDYGFIEARDRPEVNTKGEEFAYSLMRGDAFLDTGSFTALNGQTVVSLGVVYRGGGKDPYIYGRTAEGGIVPQVEILDFVKDSDFYSTVLKEGKKHNKLTSWKNGASVEGIQAAFGLGSAVAIPVPAGISGAPVDAGVGLYVLSRDEVAWTWRLKNGGFEKVSENQVKALREADPAYEALWEYTQYIQEVIQKSRKVARAAAEADSEPPQIKGPFVGDTRAWVALALKSLLRKAVEEGHDSLTWTTGEQQKTRYGLFKKVEIVEIGQTGTPGKVKVTGIRPGEPTPVSFTVDERDLPSVFDGSYDTVMRALGEPDDEGIRVSAPGTAVRMGPIGMNKFYDELVPSVLKSIIPGVVIEDIRVATEGGKQPGIKITPEIREKVMAGMPLFARRASFDPSTLTISLLSDSDLSSVIHEGGHFYLEALDNLASQPDAPQQTKDDFRKTLDWFGIRDNVPIEPFIHGDPGGSVLSQTKTLPGALKNILEQRAFHGTPHSFDTFATSAIGTGVGNTIAGHGLYFASLREVAQWYADSQAQEDERIIGEDGLPIAQAVGMSAESIAQWAYIRANGVASRVRQTLANDLGGDDNPFFDDILKIVDEYSARGLGISGRNARVFEVELRPEETEYLLWSEPLNAQSPQVKAALESLNLPFSSGREAYRELAFRLGSDEEASRVLHTLGVRGVKYQAAERPRPDTPASFNYVIFSEQDIDVVTIFNQAGEEVDRNAGGGRRMQGATPEEIWRGLTLEEKRRYHEQWAQSWERYALEGKAPTEEMRGVFARFREFMLSVYKSVREFLRQNPLAGKLNDDIRAVFDRLIAADEAIQDMVKIRGYEALFGSAEEAGMTQEQFAAYLQLDKDAVSEALDKLSARSIRDLKWVTGARNRALKALQKEAAGKRKEVEEEARRELITKPVNRARMYLGRGLVVEDDGSTREAPRKFKLNSAEVQQFRPLGEGARKLAFLTSKEGMPVNVAAQLFGFGSGDALLDALIKEPSFKEQVDGLTDQWMLERFADLADDKALSAAADEAVHNQARERFMATGLSALLKITRRKGTATLIRKAAKAAAQTAISRKRIRDLNAGVHKRAETRNNKKAVALSPKDPAGAIEAQKAALMSNQLARASEEAQSKVKATVKFLSKFRSPGTRKTIDPDYLEQIDDLIQVLDLRSGVTAQQLEKRQSLLDWIDEQEANGFEPAIDPSRMDDLKRRHYKDMTLEELDAVALSVRQIEHIGRLKKKLLTARDKRAFAARIAEAEESIRENARGKRVKERGTPTDVVGLTGKWLREAAAIHRKFNSILRQMDGGKDSGVMWDLLSRGMNEAGDRETELKQQLAGQIGKLFEALPRDAVIPGNLYSKKQLVPGTDISFTQEQRVMFALNWGNEGNRQRLMDGGIAGKKALTQAEVDKVLDTLSKEEWDFVQGVWDTVGQFRDQIGELEKSLTGVTPAWVEATPITTRYGTYRGGYFPAKYDTVMSTRSESLEAASDLRAGMKGAFQSAAARNGYTKARSEQVVGRPLLLSYNVIATHASEVVHRLSWQPWLVDANRVLKALDAPIREHYGPELLKELRDTVVDIAQGDAPAKNASEQMLNRLRVGSTVVGMGWRLTTALLQPSGLSQSWARVGGKWIARGVAQAVGNPVRSMAFIRGKSSLMRNRARTMQREINEVLNTIRAGEGVSVFQASFFWLMGRLQLVADVPTWLGAYEKALAEQRYEAAASEEQRQELEAKAVALADQAVVDSQSGGQLKDLAKVQRGGPLAKLFTNFYSYFSATYNLNIEAVRRTDFKSPLQVAILASDLIMINIVPVLFSVALKQMVKGGCDNDDLECLGKELAQEQISFLFGQMILLREMGAAAQVATGGNGYGYQGPAGLRFFSDVYKAGVQANQGELDMASFKAMNSVAGALFHYPAGQVNATVEGIMAVENGDVEGVAIIPTILFGPRKD